MLKFYAEIYITLFKLILYDSLGFSMYIQASEMNDKPVCSFCTRTRVLIICTIIAAVVAFRPEFAFIKNYDLLKIFSWFIGFSVVMIFLWKGYKEYWGKK